jgi:hypothetical protein
MHARAYTYTGTYVLHFIYTYAQDTTRTKLELSTSALNKTNRFINKCLDMVFDVFAIVLSRNRVFVPHYKCSIHVSMYTRTRCRAVFSAGQGDIGQGRHSKRGTNFNTTYVTFFTKYLKNVYLFNHV